MKFTTTEKRNALLAACVTYYFVSQAQHVSIFGWVICREPNKSQNGIWFSDIWGRFRNSSPWNLSSNSHFDLLLIEHPQKSYFHHFCMKTILGFKSFQNGIYLLMNLGRVRVRDSAMAPARKSLEITSHFAEKELPNPSQYDCIFQYFCSSKSKKRIKIFKSDFST